MRSTLAIASAPASFRERRIALLACAPVALYLAAIVAFALLNARDYASDMPRFLRYVVGPGALSLGLLSLALLAPPRIAVKVGVLGIAVLAALFAFEALLTISVMGAWLGQMGHTAGGGLETGPFRAAVPPASTLKALNRTLSVERPADAVLAHKPHVNVLLCANADGAVTYRTDRHGFRNEDAAYEAPVDVMVLGDSFVEGICLPKGKDIVARLAALRPGTVGMGTRGTGPLFQLATLGRFGPELKPDTVVIVFFAGNDWENLERSLAMPWLLPVLDPDTAFGETGARHGEASVKNAIEQSWDRTDMGVGELLRRRSLARNFLALQQTALQLGLHYPKAPPSLPVFDTVLGRAKDIAAQWDGRVVLTFVPAIDRYSGLLDNRFAHEGLRARVTGAARRTGVPVIDIAEGFDRVERPAELYAPDGHFNARGAALAARLIANGLDGIGAPSARVPIKAAIEHGRQGS